MPDQQVQRGNSISRTKVPAIAPQTVAEMFVRNVERAPNGPAFQFLHGVETRDETRDETVDETETLTWRQLGRLVCLRINALKEANVRPGDRVLLAGPNCLDWIVVDLAAQLMRAATVPVNPKLSASQREQIAAHCQPRIELNVRHAPADVQPVEPVDHEFDLAHLQKMCADIQPDELATIIYTSGTTGQPKGVMLSHRNFAANVSALLKASPVDPRETRICVLPLSHVFARTNDLYTCIAGGCCLAVLDSPTRFLDACRSIRPTFFNAVPYLLEKICEHLATDASEFRRLSDVLGGRIRAVNCGGATLRKEIEQTFLQHDIPLITGYGLTETSPVISASSIGDHKCGHVGRPLDGVQLRLSDEGEILVQGPTVMLGYYRDPQATANAIRNGWFHTGDIGRLNDGYLQIVGRSNEMIVTSTGYNVHPEELERRIDRLPGIERSCIVGNDLPCLIALIELSSKSMEPCDPASKPCDLASVQKEISLALSNLAAYQQVAAVIRLSEAFSPATNTLTAKGTLRRKAIRERYNAQIAATISNLRK